jgi:hypothetical protein
MARTPPHSEVNDLPFGCKLLDQIELSTVGGEQGQSERCLLAFRVFQQNGSVHDDPRWGMQG